MTTGRPCQAILYARVIWTNSSVSPTVQLKATLRVLAINFTFKTDPLEQTRCDFAVMGAEVTGRRYEVPKG